ncbi:MAG: Gfo/Idh/MocA family oxidoreductase [Acidimicrobiales bacterium]
MTTFELAGSGFMARIWGETILASGHRISVVRSADPERARDLAQALGAVVAPADRSGSETGACIDPAPTPALTLICSAPPDHAADALAALDRGAAVIIESPLCCTLEQADHLVAATDRGARLAAAHNLLAAPLVAEAVTRVRGLGAVHYVGVHASLPLTAHHRPAASRGGGVLFERGPQVLALVLALLGWDTPLDVHAELTLDRPASTAVPAPTDSAARLHLRLASGARCDVHLAWAEDGAGTTATPRFDVQVATAHSALRLELLPHPHLEQLGVDLPAPPRRWTDAPGQLEQFGYLDQLQQLSAALLDPASGSAASVALGRAMLDLVCAAYRSAGTTMAEPLPFTGPRGLTPWEIFEDAPGT